MKRKKTRCETARDYPIEKALAKLGHFPSKTTEKEAWFLSPFRSETQASFKVSLTKNRWYDHGAGKGGNVIDLICLINKSSVKKALDWIERDQESFSFHQHFFKEMELDGINIEYIKKLNHYALQEYISGRGISPGTAKNLCKEVHYSFKGKMYFAIGLQNNSGGWELRNKYYKNSSSPKDFTHITNGSNKLMVTEGMFDLLSLMERNKNLLKESDLLVLNSLAFTKKIVPLFESYDSIEFYLDNDNAGKNALDILMGKGPIYKDMSHLYIDYKDVNAWWIAQNQ